MCVWQVPDGVDAVGGVTIEDRFDVEGVLEIVGSVFGEELANRPSEAIGEQVCMAVDDHTAHLNRWAYVRPIRKGFLD